MFCLVFLVLVDTGTDVLQTGTSWNLGSVCVPVLLAMKSSGGEMLRGATVSLTERLNCTCEQKRPVLAELKCSHGFDIRTIRCFRSPLYCVQIAVVVRSVQ